MPAGCGVWLPVQTAEGRADAEAGEIGEPDAEEEGRNVERHHPTGESGGQQATATSQAAARAFAQVHQPRCRCRRRRHFVVRREYSSCLYAVGNEQLQRRRRFRIDTEVRCVGAHPPFLPFEPARVKPN